MADGTINTLRLMTFGGFFVGQVEDDGIGIAAEDLPHIWERFYRVDSSRSASGHSGLGLSMVKWIVEAHGGTISVKSSPGEAFKLACTVEDNFDKSINSSYYFEKMDFRKRSFYYNAYSSYVFNESLSNLVKEYSQNVLNEEENISFYFPINENGILNIWAHKKMLPIKRYYYDESNNLTFGKYKGMNVDEVKSKDEDYFKWALGYVGGLQELLFSRKYNISCSHNSI
mgnify:CR=1 FL=1